MNPRNDFAKCQPMKRFAFILRLREGAAEAYEQGPSQGVP
jgi:hypothetical protein